MRFGKSDYVLLELLEQLGSVQGRKRLQKLAFIAKLEGVPLEDEFFFHYYGPYSSELASRVDQLVEEKLLSEEPRGLMVSDGVEYGYKVSDEARALLKSVREKVPESFRQRMSKGLARALALKDRDVFQLELASTLLFWREMGHTWEDAETVTERRKKADRTSFAFSEARKIAQAVWNSRAQGGA